MDDADLVLSLLGKKQRKELPLPDTTQRETSNCALGCAGFEGAVPDADEPV